MTITKESLNATFEYREGVLYRKTDTLKFKVGDVAGINGGNGYLVIGIERMPRYVHRLIWMMHYGEIPKEIDHINGNKLDNRIENLRIATRSQNNCNKKAQSNNKLGIKGVCFDKSWKKYVAQIRVNGKKMLIGGYSTIEEASDAYKQAANKYYGEFAKY